jgi:hypothetical protein
MREKTTWNCFTAKPEAKTTITYQELIEKLKVVIDEQPNFN